MTTGELIRKFRNELGITQEELGEILGVQKSTVQKYENGSVVNYKLDVLRRLCAYFKVPPCVFIYPELMQEDFLAQDNALAIIRSMYQDGMQRGYFINRMSLNELGRTRLYDLAEDLASLPKYRSDIDTAIINKSLLEKFKRTVSTVTSRKTRS